MERGAGVKQPTRGRGPGGGPQSSRKPRRETISRRFLVPRQDCSQAGGTGAGLWCAETAMAEDVPNNPGIRRKQAHRDAQARRPI